MKAFKKPIVIEVEQLTARGLTTISSDIASDWFWDAVSDNKIIMHNFGENYPAGAYCEIKTLEGVMTAKIGDYIIKGVEGEIYPCKPEIYEKTYEIIEY